MRRLTDYEKSILIEVKKLLKFPDKILLTILPKYTYRIYKKGFRDKYFK